MPRTPTHTFSMHGGAGAILSVGLMRQIPRAWFEDCVTTTYTTGGDAMISICLWEVRHLAYLRKILARVHNTWPVQIISCFRPCDFCTEPCAAREHFVIIHCSLKGYQHTPLKTGLSAAVDCAGGLWHVCARYQVASTGPQHV